ncbi:MAG: N-acetylglucosamine-6-phosphate deacetylase [Trueperaceae bacterium]
MSAADARPDLRSDTATDGAPHAWTGGRLVLPDRVLDGRALLTEGGRIVALAREADLPADVARSDVGGAYVAPGLIDVHTHGALGRSFLDGNDDAFATITAEQARRGVTGLLATTSTAPLPAILTALERTRAWATPDRPGARVLGAHVEGPYFAAAQSGAQDPAHLRTPDDGSVDDLLTYRDAIRIVSFAPELPGACELTRRLVAAGIVAAAGHAEASDADLAVCEAWGLSHAIHLWSGQSTTRRDGPWRVPGLLEASLASDTLSGEMIADGKHLPPTLMRLAWRCFGSDRLCLISDATSGAGLPDGSPFTMGEMRYEVHDGVGMMRDRSSFAGSTTLLDGMLRVVTEQVGVPLPDAVRMASLTPARLIGMSDRIGSLTPGKRADLAILAPDLTPLRTVIEGRTVARGLEGESP